MTEQETVQPFDVAAEQAVIGAILLSSTALEEATEALEPADFHDHRHESVFLAARRLAERDAPSDVVAVSDELRRAGVPVDLAWLFGLTDHVATTANVGYYAAIVREKAIRRRLIAVASETARLAGDPSVTATDAVELARDRIDTVGAATRVEVDSIGGSGFRDYLDSLTKKPKYVLSPWPDINQLIGGFRAGGLYVVGARPGQGKSIIGLQAAARLAKEGPVAYVSLEMGKDEIRHRLIAQIAQVGLGSLTNHQVSETGWGQIRAVYNQVEQMPLFVATSDEVSTITQVRSFARSVARKGSKTRPFAGVVVDYLQLLGSSERVESRQVEVAGFSRALKLMGQSLGVPVIALSQLNRGSAQRRSPKPTLADLRESGAIEQDADVVMLLHRDEKNRPSQLDVDIAKNRQGQNGRVSLAWEGVFARVNTRTWQQETLLDDH